MNQLTGLNTGIIKSPQGVVAIALKFTTHSQGQQLVYLPHEQFQSLLFATFSGYRTLQQLHQRIPESVRDLVIAHTQALSGNIPPFAPEEVNSLNIGLRVTEFVMKQRQDKSNFLFFLQNGEVITLKLDYTQMEYVLSLLLNTIQTTDDERLAAFYLSANDFLPLYTVDFTGGAGKGINYNQFPSPEWKSAVFDTFHSIIYIQPEGTISCGAIIKAASTFEPGRIEKIARLLLQNNSMLSPYKDHVMTIDHARLDIPSSEGVQDRLLRTHLAHRTGKMN